MTSTTTQPQLNWRIDSWFPQLSEASRTKLKIYFDELNKFNKTINLVSIKTLPFADVIHFADSILAVQLIRSDSPNITEFYDLGSGNGFPGLVFASLYDTVSVKLVDSDQRKCEFLKQAAHAMGLKNVTILNQAIDKLPADSIECCLSRGWTSISKAILATRRLVKMKGSYYHLKGEGWATEVSDIPTQLCSAWTPSLVGEYKLPQGPAKFAVVKTTRIS